jgi:hypothetical protein
VANLFPFKMKVKKEMTPSKMNLQISASKFALFATENSVEPYPLKGLQVKCEKS